MRNLFIALSLCLIGTAHAAPINDQPNNQVQVNLLDNPGFERGLARYTVSGGSLGLLTSGSNFSGFGGASASFTPSAGAQTVTSAQFSVPVGLQGRACMAKITYKTAESTNQYILQAIDGTLAVISTVTLPASTSFTDGYATFMCPSSGTIALQLKAAASTPASPIYLDNAHLGSNLNSSQVSQATVYGSITWPVAASCDWSNTSTSMTSFTTNASCGTPTVTGNATAPATKIPAISFNSLPPGQYYVVVTGGLNQTGTAASFSQVQLYDGTNSGGIQSFGNYANTTYYPGISGTFTYTAAQGAKTIEVQVANGNASNTVGFRNSTIATTITVYRYPSTTETAFRFDTTPASWSGYHDATCSWAIANATFADPADDATCGFGTLYSRNLTATALGNKSPGIQFVAPKTGRYEVMVTGSAANSVGGPSDYLQLTDGNGVALDSVATSAPGAGYYLPFTLKGILDVTSAGSTNTIKIKMADSSSTYTIGGASVVPYTLHWTLKQLDTPVGMPVVVDKQVTSTANSMKVDHLTVGSICSASPCTISTQSTGWVGASSVTRTAAGAYTVTFATPYLAAPSCTVSNINLNASRMSDLEGAPTTTAVSFQLRTNSFAGQDDGFSLICMGLR